MSCPHDFNGTCPDCGDRERERTATELARLRAFAEAVRDEVQCSGFTPAPGDDRGSAALAHDQHLDDCLHCAAELALERAR
jgi:hypothetical protein